ncbi:Titin [Fasciolopsis buskii]|uniref:Titin n=1 Tax=Fasciolopsis buskii TaxID=27845 RepID=A0A8E0S0P6_9TREM|nr:Titin [Fasciolopsis buski]
MFGYFHSEENKIDTGLSETIRARVTINESGTKTSYVTGTPVVQQTYLTISNLQLTDSGDIGVRAENCAGAAQAAIRLVLSDRPQPPESVHVASTRGSDWIEVCWVRPVSDGGSKLTGYVIERRIVSTGTEPVSIRSTEWTQIGKTDVPSAPTELAAERIGPREAIVNWRPPKDLGGDIVQGYLVELRESTDPLSSPVSSWTHASTSLIKSGTTFTAH